MPDVVGIRFKPAGTTYFFDSAGIDLKAGDSVIVDTTRGLSTARVIAPPRQAPDTEFTEPLKPVIRKTTPEDLQKAAELRVREKEAMAKCHEIIQKHEIEMKPVAAEYNLDGSHLTIYFTSEKKVDFRSLLKELGATFKTRVELRQIGARDVTKLLGGSGRCGRSLCCATHLCKFDPITVRMARDQDLPLNPSMISGLCGKLLCCLRYEHDQYLTMKASIASSGKHVITPQGPGKILKINPLKETVTVKLETDAIAEFKVDQLLKPPPPAKKD